MRGLTRAEMVKRGCLYCLEYQLKVFEGERRKVCLHSECPYRELDEYKSYNEFLKNTGFDLSMLIRLRTKKKG